MALALSSSASTMFAQEGDGGETQAEEATPQKEVIKSRMALTVNQYPDSTLELNALLRARIDGAYQKVVGGDISFFNAAPDGTETAIGQKNSGTNGVASIKVPTSGMLKDEEGFLSFIARFEGDEEMTGSESDVRIRRAILEMTPLSSDSTYSISLRALTFSVDSVQPVADAAVSLFVKRMFSSLKVGEGTTDESGFVEIEFPNDLAGDQDGNLEITAVIEETEEYGNLYATGTQKWGQAVSHEFIRAPRALWSPFPPTWMVVTFFILMTAVWGHYVLIIYQLFRIKSHRPIDREESRIET